MSAVGHLRELDEGVIAFNPRLRHRQNIFREPCDSGWNGHFTHRRESVGIAIILSNGGLRAVGHPVESQVVEKVGGIKCHIS